MIERKHYASWVFFLAAGIVSSSLLADVVNSNKPIKKLNYDIEEIVVTAQPPEWRKTEQQQWRPQAFKLPEQSVEKKMEWFPKYQPSEYDGGVTERMHEKPEIKLFNFKF